MKILRVLLIGSLLAFGLFQSSPALAIPMLDVRITYVEKALDGGLWEYDYTVSNKSEAEVAIWDVFLHFNTPVLLASGVLPYGWEFQSEPDISYPTEFINVWSICPGAPPIGTDIAAGTALPGFVFQFGSRIGDVSFDAITTEWDTSSEGYYIFSGLTAPVPEPATILLMMSGFAAIGAIGRRRVGKL
jgi:hypothetical protein